MTRRLSSGYLLFVNITVSVNRCIPSDSVMVVEPGCSFTFTRLAASAMVFNGCAFVPEFTSLPVRGFTYSSCADAAITVVSKKKRLNRFLIILVFFQN
ncbi:hypothetical protein D3C71_1832300 [compost metagenome]